MKNLKDIISESLLNEGRSFTASKDGDNKACGIMNVELGTNWKHVIVIMDENSSAVQVVGYNDIQELADYWEAEDEFNYIKNAKPGTVVKDPSTGLDTYIFY